MIKGTLFVLLFVTITAVSFFPFVLNAQNEGNNFVEEAVISFESEIVINIDNSIDVSELVKYNTGGAERHGIYRDIHPYSSTGNKMKIENVSVVDENGNAYTYSISNSNENIRIKIGDPDITFNGEKVYVIRYHATRAISQLKEVDEIYWNVTGNDWGMPIYEVMATVRLPDGIQMIQSACYYGLKGSTNKCDHISTTNDQYLFTSPRALDPYEGMTVAVGFPKGVVTPYTKADLASNFFDLYWRWMVAAILPILTLIFSLRYWYKKGRDPKGTGVIIPQYDVPDTLTPMEVAGIVNQKVKPSDISAEIIYLATRGYIKIKQIEDTTLGIFKTKDYELIKLKGFEDLPNEFDKKLTNALFENNVDSVKMSDLKNVFYKEITKIIDSVLDSFLKKGYYKNLGSMKTLGNRFVIMAFVSVWVSGFFGIIIGLLVLRGNPLPLMIGIFISIVIYGIISQFSPAKTEKGVATKEYILGLKDYLRIAEKDRLKFHNAPEKRPEIFEQLLPFAMVLGVEEAWAKEFEGIYTEPPSWYSGSGNDAFSAMAFSHSLSDFNSFATSSMSSSPSSSGGSGGGGFSGGGGGGGGGGSW